jgi:CheY-like chemotaxis protein
MEIRSDEAKGEIPLIVMSSTGDERKALNLGADEFLSKPLDGEALLLLLDRLTGRKSITRVLLVDDEEVSRYLVRQLLPRSRYSLAAIGNGKLALARLQDELPDVILLDINMPEMNGYEFLERLRDDATLARIPTVVVTSAILQPRERNLLRHASLILSKSNLSSATLTEAIEGVLHPSEALWVQ